MSRLQVLDEIDIVLKTCRACEKRKEMAKTMKGLFGKQDNHCNRQCAIGQQLQELGKQLKCGERKLIREDDEHDSDIGAVV